MLHRTNLHRALLVAVFSLGALPATARADTAAVPALTPPPARPSLYRQGRGWFLSGEVGVSMVAYRTDGETASENGVYFHGRFGGMLNPRLALSAEFISDGHGYRDFDAAATTQNTLALAVSYWFLPRFWLTSGLGSSTAKGFVDGETVWQADGVSALFGAGFEVLSQKRWSVDLTLRLVTTWYDPFHRTATVMGLGGSWY